MTDDKSDLINLRRAQKSKGTVRSSICLQLRLVHTVRKDPVLDGCTSALVHEIIDRIREHTKKVVDGLVD